MIVSNRRAGVQMQMLAKNMSKIIDTGEPSRDLINGELRQLRRSVQYPPRQFCYPVTTWILQLVQHYIRGSFDVTYPLQFVDRLVETIGVAHRLERSDE